MLRSDPSSLRRKRPSLKGKVRLGSFFRKSKIQMESETKLHYDKIYDDDGGVDVDIDTTSDESSDDSSDYSGGDSDGHDQNEERPQRNVVYDSEYESIENSGSDSEGETPIKGFTFTLP